MKQVKVAITLTAMLAITCIGVPRKISKGKAVLCAKMEWERTYDFDILVIAELRATEHKSKLILASTYQNGNIFCFENLEPGRYALAYADSAFRAFFFSESMIKESETQIKGNEVKSMGRYELKVNNPMPIFYNQKLTDGADSTQSYYKRIWLQVNPLNPNDHIQPAYWLVSGRKEDYPLTDNAGFEFTD